MLVLALYGPQCEKNFFWGLRTTKAQPSLRTRANQHAHPCSLISAFVIHLLENIISKLALSEILLFQLIFVAEEAGLNLTSSETPKTGLSCHSPYSAIQPKFRIGTCFHHISREWKPRSVLRGAQWLSGRVLDSRPRGRGFEPNRRHCNVSLSKTH